MFGLGKTKDGVDPAKISSNNTVLTLTGFDGKPIIAFTHGTMKKKKVPAAVSKQVVAVPVPTDDSGTLFRVMAHEVLSSTTRTHDVFCKTKAELGFFTSPRRTRREVGREDSTPGWPYSDSSVVGETEESSLNESEIAVSELPTMQYSVKLQRNV